ncbi:hypothetical protein Trydic_g12644 [Trypoxylus dichotomus]
MLYIEPSAILGPTTVVINDTQTNTTNKDYLVFTPKCMLPDVNAWNNEIKPFYKKLPYVSCSKYKLLTYVVKNDTSAVLYLDSSAKKHYSTKPIKCCYINVTRNEKSSVPDNNIKFSDCKDFKNQLDISGSVVTVKCRSKNVIYSNTYAPVSITEEVKNKMSTYANLTKLETRPLNVLFIGIDSISRLNFIRTMPKTHEFLVNTDWVEFKGYNKIGDNTFPNLVAILTGKEYALTKCFPTRIGCIDKYGFIWKDYQNLGYVTAYAEDESDINTFNFNKKGFSQKPTDYYFRTYAVAMDHLKKKKIDEMDYCTGPESSGERILNIAKDFATTFIDYPNFGFFWMNSFSHNKLNSPTRMDNKVVKFLEDIYESGYLNNSVIIFLSDHGIRFGKVRTTHTGWLEERLPYLYFWFPKWFQNKYPEKYYNLKVNAESQLTTPYDLYMTIQDILVLSGFNYNIKSSEGCPACKSLFEQLPSRSCEDVAIDIHWCTCFGYKSVGVTQEIVKRASNFVLGSINDVIASNNRLVNKCAKYTLSKVRRAAISVGISNESKSYLLIVVETTPEAVFESTVTVVNGNITDRSYLSRLDSYFSHSGCVKGEFQKYCYCK